jgi:hypothetical protein
VTLVVEGLIPRCAAKRRFKKKNQFVTVEKKRLAAPGFDANFAHETTDFPRRPIMRSCPNTACTAFGRIFYSLTTRCPFCKWDLKNTAQGAAPQSAAAAQGARK